MKLLIKFLPVLIIVLLLVPVFVNAQCAYPIGVRFTRCAGTTLLPGPCRAFYSSIFASDQYKPCQFRTCCWIVIGAYWLRAIGFALAIVIVIVAGIMYMTSGGNETRTSSAKKTLIAGLVGAAIILMAGYILGTLAEFLGQGLGFVIPF